METKRLCIIGAGPGGLTNAMLLASRGFNVTIYEKDDHVGGRCSTFKLGDFKFDLGPTMLMMKFILDEVFEQSGRKSSDYLEFIRMDPMYKIYFPDGRHFHILAQEDKMKKEFERVFPDDVEGYTKFLTQEEGRYKTLLKLLQKDWSSVWEFFKWDSIYALPSLSLTRSLYSVLSDYFKDPLACLSFTFQAKYLGMSPWSCPGTYALIPFVEHKYGVWHTKGGLGAICEAMAKVAREHGAKINLNTKIQQIIVEDGKAKGVILENGEKKFYDEVIVNADFGYAATNLFPKNTLKTWNQEKLEKSDFSCSTFMLYLGMDKKFDIPHHNIIFAKNYKDNINGITEGRLTEDISIYICNPSASDDTMAPKGKSAIYILVPCPNLRGDVNWNEKSQFFRNRTLEIIEQKLNIPDFREHIVKEQIYTPNDWKEKHNVYIGATFNLAHNISQMIYFRPHNQFEDVENCWLVGGGTHPGSGLPTIYESGRITTKLLCKKYNINY